LVRGQGAFMPYPVVATRMAGKQLPKIGKMGTGLAMLKQHQRERSNQLTLHFLFIFFKDPHIQRRGNPCTQLHQFHSLTSTFSYLICG